MALAVHRALTDMRAERTSAFVKFARQCLWRGFEAKLRQIPGGVFAREQRVISQERIARHRFASHRVIHRRDAEFRDICARQDTSLFPREDQFLEIAARALRDDAG
ncbi:MAG: hypothetical protein IV086_11095 [Hyphomonadaceae bacterium]|nr:hypothetical protein [Hyphomonadaceae bacterium]